ncbi:MAG TPA: primosomal protein N' [Chloroflexi bacterium]|nr:primosomal protein N' [Chloroflexota bacterium]
MYAQVVIFAPVAPSDSGPASPAFTYRLPDEQGDHLTVGSLVVVPFGSRRLYGIVVALSDLSPIPESNLRPIHSLVDLQPVLTPIQIALARWMSREYLAPLYRCLEVMLPPGIVGHADVEVELARPVTPRDVYTPAQDQLVTVLDARGPLHGRQLDRLLPRQQWRRAASQLARRRVVVKSSVLAPPRARPKQVSTVEWVAHAADLDEALEGLRSECYPTIAAFLQAEGEAVDVSWVYAETGCQRYHLSKLAERGLVAFDTEEVWRDPLADETFVPDTPPPLTSDQQSVWEAIRLAIRASDLRPLLIHGVTGSGKTEIYLRAVAETLAQGRQAILLVPEISLTPQTVHRVGARFGRRVAIFHSALTEGEQYDAWRRVRAGLVDIVIGPRSALFVPFSNLGLIVLDEEHDESYKQAAPSPRYHARPAALELARLSGAAIILGSATPSLQSYYHAQRGEFRLLEMRRRILAHPRRLSDLQARYQVPHTHYRSLEEEGTEARYRSLPPVQIVDLRAELRAGNRSIFSRLLQRALDEALGRGEQAILFLNRRGTATFVLCRDCGYVPHCPNCDTPLTYHGPDAQLVCHHCNHRAPQPERCPQCRSQRIRYFGLGTAQVERTIHRRWPDVRTLRWDHDTARHYAAHAAILDLFSSGLAHVLVGTQMIAKGLDLPLVTVVGVISADTALNLPDFGSGERTFQLLTQVAGRAGRGLLGGRVVIQTYHPDHYAVAAAAAHDYGRFAAQELAFRREQGYPPFRRLVKLVYEDEILSRARSEAEALAQALRQELSRRGLAPTDLIGPVPPFFSRLRGRYRWQILLRHSDPVELLHAVTIPPGWHVDVDPVDVL